MSLRMTDLIGKAVIDATTGEKLGRAWDVRIRRENKSKPVGQESWVVEAIVIHPAGALERFGFIHLRPSSPVGSWQSPYDTVPWDAVETIGATEIKVRSDQ